MLLIKFIFHLSFYGQKRAENGHIAKNIKIITGYLIIGYKIVNLLINKA